MGTVKFYFDNDGTFLYEDKCSSIEQLGTREIVNDVINFEIDKTIFLAYDIGQIEYLLDDSSNSDYL